MFFYSNFEQMLLMINNLNIMVVINHLKTIPFDIHLFIYIYITFNHRSVI